MTSTNKTKHICIFSGSFNPIHIGHVAIASYIKEFHDVDEVWLVITPHNPLKKSNELLPDTQRFEMTKLAVEDINGLVPSDIELSLPTPTYTVNTLRELSDQYPSYKFSLAIGSDNWEAFNKWKDYEYILNHYSIIVYPRLGYSTSLDTLPGNTDVRVIDAPIMELSSTFIRKSIRNKKNMAAFLPNKVYEYISKHKLYI